MKILALIPARGGSKRLPRKNVRFLDGKPLLVWSIDICRGLTEICDILVSTDDEETAEIARKFGALVPWLRPAELATDTATTKDVALHALDWYEKEKGMVDAVLLLQPTSPFRTRETVQRGVELFRKHGNRPVVSVSPVTTHPMWCLTVDRDTMKPFMEGGGLHLRSQDLPPAFVVNGAFYMITPSDLIRHQSFYSDDMVPLKMSNPEEVIDIDTEYDWKIAESFRR
jgi:N-acylneuraminate cytidylyltransferase